MEHCIWIGIGAIIEKGSPLYSELKNINDFLTKKMSGGFGYSEALQPHVNFYDLSVKEQNIDQIRNSLNEVCLEQRSIKCNISGIKSFKFGIIFAEVEKNEELTELHRKILEAVSPYRGNCIDPDYEKLIPVLSDEQKGCLSKYGNPYMIDFRPHISLGYLPDKRSSLGEIISNIEPMLTVRNFLLNKVDFVKGKTSDKIEMLAEYKFL